MIQIYEEPKVGQTWEAKDGKILTILEERQDTILGFWYFKYIDIDGKNWYSRKSIFFFDFVKRIN